MNDTPNKKSRLQREEPAANPGRTHNRKRRKNGKSPVLPGFVLLLGVLVFSSVKIITYLKDQKNAQASQDNMNNEFVQPTPTPDPDDGEDTDKDKDKDKTEVVSQPEHKGKIDFAAMREKYPDVVGWIYGANTGLDWPIVQTAEEGGEYYLYRDIDGKDNKNGTVFLDWRCASDFSTQNNMIYGHNMKTGLMFAPLIKYKSQAFFDAHPYLYLYTPSQTYKGPSVRGYGDAPRLRGVFL